jgi:hypothetical protein
MRPQLGEPKGSDNVRAPSVGREGQTTPRTPNHCVPGAKPKRGPISSLP